MTQVERQTVRKETDIKRNIKRSIHVDTQSSKRTETTKTDKQTYRQRWTN